MRFARPGLSESALAAHFEYICALEGAQRPAYVPVVASGYVRDAIIFHFDRLTVLSHSANALIIHYVTNNHLIRPGELILVDAGCEYKFVIEMRTRVQFG
jgi:intermediate cleaving peptidase 55